LFTLQWKALQWVVQFLVPELVDASKALPVPSPPQAGSPGAAGSNSGASSQQALNQQQTLQPVIDSAVPAVIELRLQLGRAVASTAAAFGPQFARAVLLPLFSAAACAMDTTFAVAPPSPSSQGPDQAIPLDLQLSLSYLGNDMAAPGHVQEAAAELLPRSAEAVRLARCVSVAQPCLLALLLRP
jgi:hypothetical protein